MTRFLTAIAFLGSALNLFGARADIIEGNPSSPAKVFIHEVLQAGDCLNFRIMLDEKILPRYGKRVAFLHRDLPLPRHNWARYAAIAGRWVYEQSPTLGITFRREILSEQDHITPENLTPWLREFARRNKLDQDAIVASMTDPHLVAIVDQDYQGATARGVNQVPTIFIGNQSFAETIIYEDIAKALDVELGK